MSQRDFDANLKFAQPWERAVAVWLLRRSWHLLPAYDYVGLAERKAPKLFAVGGRSIVSPDLLIARDGRTRWAEVKLKTEASRTRINGNRLETAIDTRLWKQYQAAELVTGIPVWLMFVHFGPDEVRGLRAAPIRKLAALSRSSQIRGKAATFFPCSALEHQATLEEIAREVRGVAA